MTLDSFADTTYMDYNEMPIHYTFSLATRKATSMTAADMANVDNIIQWKDALRQADDEIPRPKRANCILAQKRRHSYEQWLHDRR